MNLKSFVFAAFLALFAMPVSAQNSDDFFRVDDDFNGTRDAITYWTATNGIGNNGIGQSEAPVGSGLLILTAVGAGYAIYRRKHNFKNGTTLLLAFALLLGMTQCKKNVETITPMSNTVHITLNVDGGSRVSVTPGDEFATVTFEEGDVIYVGYNNACLGSLTYNAENQKFEDDVAFVTPVGDDSPLHFYFLGNKTPTITETTKYTVDIIDQTSKYPVISYNHSNEVYTGAGEYTANLFNYCSFMKFTTDNVTDINSQVLCITGMNNTVTVDFNGNGITYGIKAESNGLIQMPTSTDGNRWAIVLPQEELAAGSYGSVYTPNEYFKGSRPALDEIERNEYLKAGKELKLYDVRFSISNTQKVLFSPGNLVKTDPSYEVGSGNETYAFETTLFNTNGGSLGYNSTPSETSARGYFTWNEIATANETPRPFTVNGISGWKAMTFDEWNYLYYDGRTMNTGVHRCYIVDLGSDGNQIGMLLPPDGATSIDVADLEEDEDYITEDVDLETYISKGFVFLPASGYCSVGYMGVYWDEAGDNGYYWYTTEDESDKAYYLNFYDCGYSESSDNKNPSPTYAYYCSVRLVRDVE